MPLAQFCCSLCGTCAPKKLLAHGMFEKRMAWLREHRQQYHPGAFKASTKKGVESRVDGHLTTEGLQCTVISVGKAK